MKKDFVKIICVKSFSENVFVKFICVTTFSEKDFVKIICVTSFSEKVCSVTLSLIGLVNCTLIIWKLFKSRHSSLQSLIQDEHFQLE